MIDVIENLICNGVIEGVEGIFVIYYYDDYMVMV